LTKLVARVKGTGARGLKMSIRTDDPGQSWSRLVVAEAGQGGILRLSEMETIWNFDRFSPSHYSTEDRWD
jgi:hypothetical protein